MLQGGVLETLVQCYGTSGDCNTHIQKHKQNYSSM